MNMHTMKGAMRTACVVAAMLLPQSGCSRSENVNDMEQSHPLPDTITSSNQDLSQSLIGQWQTADGSGYVVEFTNAGLMSIRNTSGESQVRFQGDDEFPYMFIAENVLKAGAALPPEHANLFPREWFQFSVLVEGDSLAIRGAEESLQVTLSQDGISQLTFPGSEAESMKFIRVAQ